MSAPKPRLSLTKRAQRDVRAIQVYTLRTWGPEQARSYEAAIDEALETVRDHPRLRTNRDDLRPGVRSFPVERRVLYFRRSSTGVEILRILHERADASRPLGARRPQQPGQ